MRRPPRDLAGIAGAGLLASPAAALWMASATMPQPRRRVVRAIGLSASAGTAALLALTARPWETTALLWLAFLIVGTGIALWLATAEPTPEADAAPPLASPVPFDDPARAGEARDVVRAIAVALLALPWLLLFIRCLAAAAIGPWLVRLDPDAVELKALAASFLLDLFLLVPGAAVFAALAARRGRLASRADVGRAVAAWAFYLAAVELLVAIPRRALSTQMLAAERGAAAGIPLPTTLALAAAAAPLTLLLACGKGRFRHRAAGVAGLLVGASIGLALLTGTAARAQFVTGRWLEREGDVEGALGWYRKSLRAHSSPLLESYLQHRVGLLHYKLGDEARAAAAFRLVRTSRNANEELAREASWYLEHLARETPRRRVVLANVEGETERRGAYCAPNTLALLFRYWGLRLTPSAIGEQVAWIDVGTTDLAIDDLFDRQGFDHLLVPWAQIDDVRWLVDQGIPALLYLPGHVLAVFGYDQRLGSLVAYDTAVWDIWVDEPVEFLLERWGGSSFSLGVVLPRTGGGPGIERARQRFAGLARQSARPLVLARTGTDAAAARAQLRAAVRDDPGWLEPAAWLGWRGEHRWLLANEDGDEIVRRGRVAVAREHAPLARVASTLAGWLSAHRRDEELLALADDLEARGQLAPVREPAGVAAARLRHWERAANLLAAGAGAESPSDQRRPSLEAREAWLRANLALGHADVAAVAAERLAWFAGDDRLEEALAAGEPLALDRGADVLERLYMGWLGTRSDDAPRQLAFAGAVAEAVSRPGASERRIRLQRARAAVELARGYTRDPEVLARAQALAQRLEQPGEGANR